MGTLSKAFGLAGGYVAAGRAWVELWVNRARGFVYSTAPPPALAETARASLRLVQGEEGGRRRDALFRNVERFDRLTGGAGTWRTPIRPVLAGASALALAWAESLAERGFLVPAIRFPTVPRGTARLRVSLGAGHRPEQVERLAAELARLRESAEGGVDDGEDRE
jgi:7-keto-8-aminopelargonate synthetase-like enzyme